jgi:peptide chain release factor 2
LRSGGIFDLPTKEKQIEVLNQKMAEPNFWDNPPEAQATVEKLKALKRIVEPWQKAFRSVTDHIELIALIEVNDEKAVSHFYQEVTHLTHQVNALELERLLSDPLDASNAIATLNSGAGGTESCDWAAMLMRMYTRWAERSDYEVVVFDVQDGEEAGIKSAMFMVKGHNAYGYLKAEVGVHRLVRISPFDSNKRRHTSFASFDAIPEVTDNVEIEINEADIRLDTYRAGGKGGQHVNKTSSAIRITHIPTGIVVQCQNERSQHQNRAMAYKVLKAKLYEKKRREEEAKLQSKYGEKKRIEWGSQIRSYVFHPYTLVKDHRTDFETSNGQAVMDGDIDGFIEAYLKQTTQERETRKGQTADA